MESDTFERNVYREIQNLKPDTIYIYITVCVVKSIND